MSNKTNDTKLKRTGNQIELQSSGKGAKNMKLKEMSRGELMEELKVIKEQVTLKNIEAETYKEDFNCEREDRVKSAAKRADLEEGMLKLQKNERSFKEENDKLKKENDNLKKINERLTAELNVAKETAVQNAQVKQSQEQGKACKQPCEEKGSSKTLKKLTSELNRTKEQLQYKTTETDNYKAELKRANEQLAVKTIEVNNYKKDCCIQRGDRAENGAEKDDFKVRLSELQKNDTRLNEENIKLRSDINKMTAELNAAKEEIAVKVAQVKQYQKQVEAYKQQCEKVLKQPQLPPSHQIPQHNARAEPGHCDDIHKVDGLPPPILHYYNHRARGVASPKVIQLGCQKM